MSLLIITLCIVGIVAADLDLETKRLAMENPDLYDGDMLGINGPFDVERNGIPGRSYRWPQGTVPYTIDHSLGRHRDLIKDAMGTIESHTCIRFRKREDEKDYISLFAGQGCYSQVGKLGGEQELSLGEGCHDEGTVIHELLHALGFYHEQSRSDRDNYLWLYLFNVNKGKEENFIKLPPTQNILYNEFDYDSVMLYGNKAFSKNRLNTMEAKTGQQLLDPSLKKMSARDIERVNLMYGCSMENQQEDLNKPIGFKWPDD